MPALRSFAVQRVLTPCALLAVVSAVVSVGCARHGAVSAAETRVDAPSSGAQASCAAWGGRGFSLVVRAQSSHALFFREFAYDDRDGTLRVHDSDLFASPDGHESREPRVIQRTITLSAEDRARLAEELVALCPNERELASVEAPGGGTVLRITTAAGVQSTVRYAAGAPGDVARRTHARFVQYFPELRRQ